MIALGRGGYACMWGATHDATMMAVSAIPDRCLPTFLTNGSLRMAGQAPRQNPCGRSERTGPGLGNR